MFRIAYKQPRTGFTLIELSFVILVVALVASLAAVRFGSKTQEVKIQAAEMDLLTLRTALIGSEVSTGYLGDLSTIPGFTPVFLRIHNLLNRTNIVARAANAGGDSRWISMDRYAQDHGADATPPHCASFQAFSNWNDDAKRGWRGPYIQSNAKTKNTNAARVGLFPAPNDCRREDDATFAERGFFPSNIPDEVPNYAEGFGVAGEQALGDPWGNPYVLQIPPPSAFEAGASVSPEKQFEYARLVSAGPNGILESPCYTVASGVSGDEARRAFLRLAGRRQNGDVSARGDDILLFVNREDLDDENE